MWGITMATVSRTSCGLTVLLGKGASRTSVPPQEQRIEESIAAKYGKFILNVSKMKGNGGYIIEQVSLIIMLVSILMVSESMGQNVSIYLSVEELYNYCNSPAPCGRIMECEGKTIRIRGYIDLKNIFFKEEYPQLPYEKFSMYDRVSDKVVEVFVNSKAARGVYRMIQQQTKTSQNEVFIKGTISGFDMPVMGQCYRGIRIELNKSEDMKFR